jgi:hypothetical protein
MSSLTRLGLYSGTLLRICEVFDLPMSKLVQGLDREDVYESLDVEIPPRRRSGRKR